MNSGKFIKNIVVVRIPFLKFLENFKHFFIPIRHLKHRAEVEMCLKIVRFHSRFETVNEVINILFASDFNVKTGKCTIDIAIDMEELFIIRVLLKSLFQSLNSFFRGSIHLFRCVFPNLG